MSRATFILYLLSVFPVLMQAQYFSVPLPLTNDSSTFTWNGLTPLFTSKAVGSKFSISVMQDKEEISLKASFLTNKDTMEEEIHFTPSKIIDVSKESELKIVDSGRLWPLQTRRFKISWTTNSPTLEIVSASPSITHGGAAVAVLRSELSNQLLILAFQDEQGTLYYPQTFKQDGFYTLIFPWYMSHSTKWDKVRFVAMDKAGNMSVLHPGITTKNRTFKEKRIMLSANYGEEKAKELNLSPEETKKLQSNITAINSALSAATVRPFDRWLQTRQSFSATAEQTIPNAKSVFAKNALPIKNDYYVTATYGDRRRYFFQNKQVRESVHAGQDMARGVPNNPIYSILDGTVVYTDWNRGNGKTVVVDHGLGVYSFYAHNNDFTVAEGDKVKAGQQIAISGTTGQSTGDHLHLSVIVQGMYVEPAEWLSTATIKKQFIEPLIAAEKLIASGRYANPITKILKPSTEEIFVVSEK
ncbi:MAG: M23 family metallopeptidase [Brevinema sp.]